MTNRATDDIDVVIDVRVDPTGLVRVHRDVVAPSTNAFS